MKYEDMDPGQILRYSLAVLVARQGGRIEIQASELDSIALLAEGLGMLIDDEKGTLTLEIQAELPDWIGELTSDP